MLILINPMIKIGLSLDAAGAWWQHPNSNTNLSVAVPKSLAYRLLQGQIQATVLKSTPPHQPLATSPWDNH